MKAWLLLSLTGSCGAAVPDNFPQQPNVIIVMTDDQGYGDIASHGNDVIQTPQLDKLRATSLRLTNYHVDPTCSPTRASLMTGRYAARTGVWHTIMGRSLLRKNEITMANVFQNNGYATGMFGKWHLGDNYPYRPHDRGFDTVVWHKGGGVGQGPDYFGNDYFDDTYFVKDTPKKFKGYCTDIWFDEAMAFIEKNQRKPFFCYIATNAAHSPYVVPNKYSDLYKNNRKDQSNATHQFLGMITNIDDNMGRLDAKLKELNIADNTLLIFTTDNGTARGHRIFNAGMKGTKGSQYDGGHRVPFFVRWPKANLPVGDIDTLTAHIDILPTMIDLCGLKGEQAKFDGQSLKELWYGNNNLGDRILIVDNQRVLHPKTWLACSVMTQQWRLINGTKLFDIQKDPQQSQDVADQHPGVVKKLRSAYEKNWKTLEWSHKNITPISIGSSFENPTTLMSHDILTTDKSTPWSQRSVIRADKYKGYWAVYAEQDGTYTFDIRRWPQEIAKGFNDKHLSHKTFKVKSVKFKTTGIKKNIKVTGNPEKITVTIQLKKGLHNVVAHLICDDGERNAYYVDVKKH